MNTNLPAPKRGEIWRVNFDPTVGSETRKRRPAVVISSDATGHLPLKLVVPITEWDDRFQVAIWHVRIPASKLYGLRKESSADTFQTRSVALERFEERLGRLPEPLVEEIAAALAAIIEYQ